jgi:hypothetical protein
MKATLDFFEKYLPQHVSRALGERLSSNKAKKSKMPPHGQEETASEEAAESPEAEQQEESGIPEASQEDEGQSAIPPAPSRKVFMIPSESDGKRKKPGLKAPARSAPPLPQRSVPLKPRVLGR